MNKEEEYNEIAGATENINIVCTNSDTLMANDNNNPKISIALK